MKIALGLICFFAAMSTSHADPISEWLRNSGLEVHRLSVGETKVVKGMKFVCGPDNLKELQEGIKYLMVTARPVRFYEQKLVVYCGSKQDAIEKKAAETQKEESILYPVENRYEATCRITTRDRTVTESGEAYLTVSNKYGSNTTIFKNLNWNSAYHFRKSIAEAIEKCMDLDARNACTCIPTPRQQ